jgi:iron complex outermembrane receptor protein
MKIWLLTLIILSCLTAHAQLDTLKNVQPDSLQSAQPDTLRRSRKAIKKEKKISQQDTVKDETNDLSEVKISSRYNKKYNISELSKTLRMATPLLQLPQNIQEIGKEILTDQLAFNMTDGITRNVSGVIRQEISNNLGPFIFMRGGLVSTLRDGIDLTPIYRGPVPEDAAVIERVEFIKGPSMFMNSIGDPAGTFNVVTKQPTGKNNYSAEFMAGSFDFYRAAADLDGLIDKNGKLQYRFNVMGMKSNSFVKYDFNDRLVVAPVLKYVINDRNSLTASYTYQKFSYGLMSPIIMTPNGFGTLPKDFTISEPSVDAYRPTDQSASLNFHHTFNPNWAITAVGGFMQNDNSGAYMWVTGVNKANPNVLLRNPKYDLTRSVVYSEQVFLNGKLNTGGVGHQLLAGIDVNQKRFLADSYIEYDKSESGTLNYYPLDVNNAQYGATVPNYSDPNAVEEGNTNQRINYASFYALDEISFFQNKLRFTLGGRFTTAKTNNEVLGINTQSSNQIFTPRVGVSYSLTEDLSLYYLNDRTFTPQAGSIAPQADGTGSTAVKAKTGTLYELGIKKDWFEGKWNTTLSVYHVKRSGVLSANPDNSAYYIQIGKSTAKGIDFDLKGRIVKGLNAVINYAYTDSKITSDLDPKLIGARTPLYVKHIQNTWLTYDLPLASLKGLGISAGYQYQAGRSGRYAVATPYTIPDFFRLDGGIRWSNQKVRVNMIVNNVLNKNLIGTPWLRNGLYYWIPQAPANVRISIGYTF